MLNYIVFVSFLRASPSSPAFLSCTTCIPTITVKCSPTIMQDHALPRSHASRRMHTTHQSYIPDISSVNVTSRTHISSVLHLKPPEIVWVKHQWVGWSINEVLMFPSKSHACLERWFKMFKSSVTSSWVFTIFLIFTFVSGEWFLTFPSPKTFQLSACQLEAVLVYKQNTVTFTLPVAQLRIYCLQLN